ncbi:MULTISPECIES: fimbrial biogenesis chaperone [unclassified Serratia (in: enterobacteria)]|uniref:fimbrial biogenesis chaperone n=1 Tax=unclassified Serratia (in: enterobacteria) TaxID=2647522 RepID=UPI0030761ACE
MNKTRIIALLSLVLCSWVSQVQANIVISGTRLVYPAKEREITVKTTNMGKDPSLAQVWVDRGDPNTRADNANAPFLVTPPLVRIEPGKGQAFRVVFTGESLPKDRESLFWFNLLDVPPLPKDADANVMQVAYRSRIKLFYRPEGLADNPVKAAESLTWSRGTSSKDGTVLQVRNNSPFYVSLASVSLKSGNTSIKTDGGYTLAPFSTQDVTLKGPGTLPVGQADLTYSWVNDYGAAVEQKASLKL